MDSLVYQNVVVPTTSEGRGLEDFLCWATDRRCRHDADGEVAILVKFRSCVCRWCSGYLFDEGLDKILKKVGEESAETIIAAKNNDQKPFVAEVSDLIYHLLVLLVARGVNLDDVRQELVQRK